MTQLKRIIVNFKKDNDYDVAKYIKSFKYYDITKDLSTNNYEKLTKHRNVWFSIAITMLVLFCIPGIILIFYSIPYQIFWANTKDYYEFDFLGLGLWGIGMVLWFIVFVSDHIYIDNLYAKTIKYFNIMMNYGYICQDIYQYPQAIQMYTCVENHYAWKYMPNKMYPAFNYYIFLRSLFMFYDKLNDYYIQNCQKQPKLS